MNLCGRESLCDIRRDCCHHFVSERDFERDAQRVCKAERSLKSPLAGTKRQALRQTSHERNKNDRQNSKICIPYSRMAGILLCYNNAMFQGTGVIVFLTSAE